MIATSSEDGTLKIWDFKQEGCIATLRGHSSDIWCITKATFSTIQQNFHERIVDIRKINDYAEELIIFSGGNDGSIKAWPLAAHCKASASDASTHLSTLALPRPFNSIIISSSSSSCSSSSDININGNNSSNINNGDAIISCIDIPSIIDPNTTLPTVQSPQSLPITHTKSQTSKPKLIATSGESALATSKPKKSKTTPTTSSKKTSRPPRPPSSRGSNGVSVMRLTADGKWAVVLMCEGEIWMVNLELAVLASIPVVPHAKKVEVQVTSATNLGIKTQRGSVADDHTNGTFASTIKSSGISNSDLLAGQESSQDIEVNSSINEQHSIIKEEEPLKPYGVKVPEDCGWTYIGTLEKGITNADVAFYTHIEWTHMALGETTQSQKNIEDDRERKLISDDDIYCRITGAHRDGFVSLIDVIVSHEKKFEEPNDILKDIIRMPKVDCSLSILTWKAHDFRTINVWQLKTVPRIDDIYFNGYILSSSLKGGCKLWGRRRVGGRGLEERDSSGGGLNETEQRRDPYGVKESDISRTIRKGDEYDLLFECVTGKEQIATCCALLDRNCLLIGDCRGGISLYKWNDKDLYDLRNNQKSFSQNLDENFQESQTQKSDLMMQLNLYIPHVHGDDLVSCIKPCSRIRNNGFCSVGHDGMFCVYDNNGGLISRMNCLPIKTPNEITLNGEGSNASIYIGGYLGDMYLVWDIRRGYQVMRIEAGGWRR
jgi:hypothetical protein